jgi:transcriptional regulator with XRE-family HTH domain
MFLGKAIARRRRELGLTQKQLAELIKKEDGETISLAYLNDIEHGRRNRPSDHLLNQFAEVLDWTPAYIYYCANEMPIEIRGKDIDPKRFEAAYRRFLKELAA